MIKEKSITVGKLAALLNLSRQAVYVRMRRRDLPFSRRSKHPGHGQTIKGRRIVFTPEQVDAWLSAYAGGRATWKHYIREQYRGPAA